MESLLLLSVVLLMVGLILAVAEIFVPSGGLLGILAALALGAGIVCAWMHKPIWGVGTLTATIVLIPIIIVVGFRIFPRTAVGRQMIHSAPEVQTAKNDAATAASRNGLAVGTPGRAGTDLRPSGTGLFGEERLSVVTEGEWIEHGTGIRVVKVEGNRIIVEADS